MERKASWQLSMVILELITDFLKTVWITVLSNVEERLWDHFDFRSVSVNDHRLAETPLMPSYQDLEERCSAYAAQL